MKRSAVVTPGIVFVVSIFFAYLLIISRPEVEHINKVKPVLLVEVFEVVKQTQQVDVKAHGIVEPRTQTTLVSEVKGRVSYVAPLFSRGGFFRRGEVLLRIDGSRYNANLKRAKATLAHARSELAQEKGRASVAKKEWAERRDAHKLSAEAESLALRQPQTIDAEANVHSAEAALQDAENDLKNTIVRAPYDGIVRKKDVDIGQYVSIGSRLGVTFAIDQIEVRLALPEHKIPYIDLPDAIRSRSGKASAHSTAVILSTRVAGVEHQWMGRLVRTEGVLDERSRVLFAVVQVDDPYGIDLLARAEDFQPLRVGSFVEASIPGRHLTNLALLPPHVLRTGNKVWVIDKDKNLQERQVEVLNLEGEKVYVSEGLIDGDLVCLTHLSSPLPGVSVEITKVSLANKLHDRSQGHALENIPAQGHKSFTVTQVNP